MSSRRSDATPSNSDNSLSGPLLPLRQTRVVLQLALGYTTSVLTPAEWDEAFSISVRERLVGLAWQRQREAIRRFAPAPLANRWRIAAVRLGAQVNSWVSVLVDVTRRLEQAGLSPIVLKGPPLALRLYGDPSVRPISDLDLILPAPQRAEAFDVLVEAGWKWITGEAPGEEMFQLSRNGETFRLEVHSTVIDDPLLGYVALPFESKRVAIGDVTMDAMDGALLAASQAAHLAKHHSVPLLWIVDFCELMQGMTPSEWEKAREAATRCGLQYHLGRAEALGHLAWESAKGSDDSLARLCAELKPVSELKRGLRLLGLSANTTDAFRVLGGRLWPRQRRNGWRRVPLDTALRTSTWIYRGLAASNASLSANHDVEFLSRTEAAPSGVDAGGYLWFRQPDDSMRPAIPPSATVRVLPAASASFARGQIVLIRTGDGRDALRRVVSGDGEVAVVRADLLDRRSWTIPVSSIRGTAISATAYGATWQLSARAYDLMPLICAFLRARGAALASKLRQTRAGQV
jgi:hypothetical protein